MQLMRCYREGGQRVYIVISRSIYDRTSHLFHPSDMAYQHWLDIFNAMATGPADSPITMFEVAHSVARGVFEFEDRQS